MKARIVLATDSQEPSGMGEHMLTLGAALAYRYDVTIAAPAGDFGRPLLVRAARLGLRIKGLDLEHPTAVREWLAAHGSALLHVHAGIGWEGHGLVRAGKAAGMPVVRTEHLPYLLTSVVQQAEYRAMLLSVDRRIAVSDAVASSYAEAGDGQMTVVRNGIAPRAAQRTRDAVLGALGMAAGEKLLLTIARFTPQKGYDVLVAAAAQVAMADPSVRFALVGDGPERAAIAAAVAEQDLADRVHLLGAREDVADLLAAADLFVLPSHFEGLSLALLEAMAAGLPVVATDIGGTREAIGASHPFLVPPNDPDALAATILRVLGDRDAAQAAAQAASARVTAQFGARRMAEETAAIYDDLLSTNAHRGAHS